MRRQLYLQQHTPLLGNIFCPDDPVTREQMAAFVIGRRNSGAADDHGDNRPGGSALPNAFAFSSGKITDPLPTERPALSTES